MKLLVFTILVGFGFRALAIENLQPCEHNLVDYEIDPQTPVDLQPNEILIRGNLFSFRHPESYGTAWGIVDQHLSSWVTPDPGLSQFYLEDGDRVYLLKEDQTILAQGYYHEAYKPAQGKLDEFDFFTYVNLPALYKDRNFKHITLTERQTLQAFQGNFSAVVIKKLRPGQKDRLRRQLEPWELKADAHHLSPLKMQRVGDRRVRVAHFQTLLKGQLQLERVEKLKPVMNPVTSAISTQITAELRFFVQFKEGARIAITYGDHLFLLNSDGKVYQEIQFEGSYPDSDWTQGFLRSASVAVLTTLQRK